MKQEGEGSTFFAETLIKVKGHIGINIFLSGNLFSVCFLSIAMA